MEIIIPIIIVLILISLKQVNEYERGVVYTMGRFSYLIGPGWKLVIPIFQSFRKVDIRTKAVDVPKQDTITKDNVTCKMNAVIYYKVTDAGKTINEVEDVFYAMLQLAQTTMRRVASEATLDELLSQREKIATKILAIVEKHATDWGIDVQTVELKDIELPESMVRTMAKQAEAERERRAKIIHAEGEMQASAKLAEAATVMATAPNAIQLRYLQTLTEIATEKNSTIIFPVPIDILDSLKKFLDK